MLGVLEHAEGGIWGSVSGDYGTSVSTGEEIWVCDASPVVHTGNDAAGENSEVVLNVNVNPKFEISGEDSSEDNILEIIRTHMKEMADELGGQMAMSLEEVFSNMPVREV